MTPLPEELFSLKYDGENYQGEMSARELASVLVSVTDYVQAVASTGYLGRNTRIGEVKVQVPTEGSFNLDMFMEFTGAARDVIETLALLGGSYTFWWRYMRRRVTDYEHLPERGVFRVTFNGNDVVEMTEAEWALLNNNRARRALRGLFGPLRRGATSVQITSGSQQLRVEAGQEADFEPLDHTDEVAPQRFDMWAQPEMVNFDATKVWRVSSQHRTYSVRIEDRQFLNDVESGRTRVGRSDSFHLAVRVEIKREDGNESVRYFVERVLDHHQGAEQDELPEDGSEGTQ